MKFLFKQAIFLSFLFTNTVLAQNFEKLDSIASHLRQTYGIQGIGIVGVKENRIVYMNTAGIANPYGNFTDSTHVYIASNTKAFTALAMQKLALEGKIKYSDPISEYLPKKYFTNNIEISRISVNDLLAHTHGLSNDPMVFRTAYSGEYPEDLRELLKFTVYKNDSLSKEFDYTNTGYLLAGMIIKNVTGLSWSDYLHQHILPTLKMNNTSATMGFRIDEELMPYDYDMDLPLLKSRKSENTLSAAGGLFSTLPDIARWLMLFTDPNQSIMDPTLLEQYFAQHTLIEENDGPIFMKSYGNGWFFGNLILKESLFFHFGRFKGYESVMSFDPETNAGVFVIVNERIGGVYVAALLSNYFYLATDEKPQSEKFLAPVISMIDKTYSTPVKRPSKSFSFENSHALSGTYTSDEYGTLLVNKYPEGYSFRLGKLESLAYAGDQENEIVVEWTPGILEHFYIKEKNGQLELQYDEFDVFKKK